MGLLSRVKTKRAAQMTTHMSYRTAILQGSGTREYQEDSFGVTDCNNAAETQKYGLFTVLADGMGGMRYGKAISQSATDMCLSALGPVVTDLPRNMSECIVQVSDSIYERYAGSGGTTLVMLKIYDGKLWWASVGDSAVYLKRGGAFYRLNREHSFLNELYLKELFSGNPVDKLRAETHIDAKSLSEFIGNTQINEIDRSLYPLQLENSDTLLLCSDGITDFIGEAAISAALDHTPAKACAVLRQEIDALRHPDQDNFTAIVIRCAQKQSLLSFFNAADLE